MGHDFTILCLFSILLSCFADLVVAVCPEEPDKFCFPLTTAVCCETESECLFGEEPVITQKCCGTEVIVVTEQCCVNNMNSKDFAGHFPVCESGWSPYLGPTVAPTQAPSPIMVTPPPTRPPQPQLDAPTKMPTFAPSSAPTWSPTQMPIVLLSSSTAMGTTETEHTVTNADATTTVARGGTDSTASFTVSIVGDTSVSQTTVAGVSGGASTSTLTTARKTTEAIVEEEVPIGLIVAVVVVLLLLIFVTIALCIALRSRKRRNGRMRSNNSARRSRSNSDVSMQSQRHSRSSHATGRRTPNPAAGVVRQSGNMRPVVRKSYQGTRKNSLTSLPQFKGATAANPPTLAPQAIVGVGVTGPQLPAMGYAQPQRGQYGQTPAFDPNYTAVSSSLMGNGATRQYDTYGTAGDLGGGGGATLDSIGTDEYVGVSGTMLQRGAPQQRESNYDRISGVQQSVEYSALSPDQSKIEYSSFANEVRQEYGEVGDVESLKKRRQHSVYMSTDEI